MLIAIFCLLLSNVYGHSWIHCIDYTGSLQSIDNTKCKSWPRGMTEVPFGLDQGMNYQPTNDHACKNTFTKAIEYSPGKKIQIIWPAKNHKADTCTNPYIPKGSLGIYVQSVDSWNQPDLSFSNWYTNQYKYTTLEFQNCPYFCENMDKSACAGNLTLPSQKGKYKMIWIWMFNPGQFYTHCFDIEIIASFISKPPSLTNRQPKCRWCNCEPLTK